MAINLKRLSVATALAAVVGTTGSGCAMLDSQELPKGPCAKAGYVPVIIKSGKENVSQVFYDNATPTPNPYALMDIHDPALNGHREGAALGGGAALGVSIIAGSSTSGKILATVVGTVGGAMVGRSEAEASKTGNLSACWAAIKRGDYAVNAIEVDIGRGAGPQPVGRSQTIPNGRKPTACNTIAPNSIGGLIQGC